jgi:hypothetical protein
VRRARIGLLGLLVFGVGFGLAAWLAPAAGAGNPAAADPPGPRWEYCEVVFASYEPLPLVVVMNGKKYTAANVAEMGKHLGYEPRQGDTTEVLDALGRDGWELVTHAMTAGPKGVLQAWTLKRPRR